MGTATCGAGSLSAWATARSTEYRMMTDDERNRWHAALNTLKRNGEYDRLSAEHQAVGSGSGAHSGPGFLPWHREYLKRVEIAFRLIDPSISVPYWDSVLDQYLPDPRDSILFSDLFAGQTDPNGFVITGPFAFWRTLEGRPYILRNLGQEGQLFNENQVNQVMEQTNVEYVLAYTAPLAGCPYPTNFGALEYTHSNIHLWVGGDMKPPTTSANDPIFFMHHSFVDHIWELWRQLRQSRWVREEAFTPDLPQCANPQHFSYATMRPFNLINRDGLSNGYTDQMYRYQPRPSCSMELPTCGSRYLFCDNRAFVRPHCVAKIKLGGNCNGFESLDACFQGRCIMGRCVPGPTPAPWRPTTASPIPRATSPRSRATTTSPRTTTPDTTTSAPAQNATNQEPFVQCLNRGPCCDLWKRQGECESNQAYMHKYCMLACGLCQPTINTTDECTDRHVACAQWHRDGQCTGKSTMFMEENCRASCGLCSEPKLDTCLRTSHSSQSKRKPEGKAAPRKLGDVRRAPIRHLHLGSDNA
uniref:ShTK domain protein n=1 Tax=Steinernema glaseri TaxID=37863 RepID=A0A1I8A771_9BILA